MYLKEHRRVSFTCSPLILRILTAMNLYVEHQIEDCLGHLEKKMQIL